MKALWMTTLVLAALTVFTIPALAQDRERGRPRPITLECCQCLGRTDSLDISTGQGGPIDPLWKVNGGNAYATSPFTSWTTDLSPAGWIQPSSAGTPDAGAAAGDYTYTVDFRVPRCRIPMTVRVVGSFATDNSAEVFLDNPPAIASCPGPVCFATSAAAAGGLAPVAFNGSVSSPGNHTLKIVVRNNESYTGLVVKAKLYMECARE